MSEHENEGGKPDEEETAPSAPTAVITDGMSEAEIRAAGLAVDVPYESGEAKPERLSYADLGEGKRFTGKVPEPGVARTTEDDDDDRPAAA